MISIRKFTKTDAAVLQQRMYREISIQQIEDMILEWDKKQVKGRYFEMFAILENGTICGTISLYQLAESTISIGPEVFLDCRRKGIGKQAMILAFGVAKEKGYKIVSQQIRVDNQASIALHTSLGFETDGVVYKNAKGNQVLDYSKNLA